ncbi:hypothetical protein HMPREF0765_0419 [Sphingobacterium spiritivorum ATCC 33300]|uniref:Uncharacterized protein n=1 Tax=Sphingobacterium spiritivorum ATCC 33300 TaxID=525372 RepID=C2FSW3_SPHSI|nr:hypothetical protein HMPREF0765_0419 [Sphingobacterium spiritivorum ATCC 33300]
MKEFPAFIEKLTVYLSKEYQNPNFDFLINNAGTGDILYLQTLLKKNLIQW